MMNRLLPRLSPFFAPRVSSLRPFRVQCATAHSLRASRLEIAAPKYDFGKLVAGQTASALLLTKPLLSAADGSSNVVYSPLSIHVAMSMLAAGSQGSTRDQLLSFLGAESVDQLNWLSSEAVGHVLADGTQSGGPKLSCVNGLWIHKSLRLRNSFKQMVGAAYKAEITPADFVKEGNKVKDEVNRWVNEKTNGLITDLLQQPPTPLTMMMLVNAVYFKGAWLDKFHEHNTEDHDFFLLDGGCVEVPFMSSSKKQAIRAFDGFKVLRLPYECNDDERSFSMCIFLPDARDGLPALVENVWSDPGFLERHIPYTSVQVGEFWIPRFKMSSQFQVEGIMKEMGLVLPFSMGDGFAEMADPPENQLLGVSSVLHKSFIEVNEEGTEAAAVTSIGLLGCSLESSREKTIDFVADHPFMFVVREDKSKMLLFIGQVVNPKPN